MALPCRYVKMRRGGRYVQASSRTSVIHMDKVIFSSEDLVWAMDAQGRTTATNGAVMDGPLRNANSSLHTLNLQPLSRTGSKRVTNTGMNTKMLQKVCGYRTINVYSVVFYSGAIVIIDYNKK